MSHKELRKIKRYRKLPGGVVLTGGSAKLPGIEGMAKEKLQLAARVGSLQPISGLVESVEDVSYATAVGLMLLDMLLPVQQPTRFTPENPLNLVDSLFRRFKRK